MKQNYFFMVVAALCLIFGGAFLMKERFFSGTDGRKRVSYTCPMHPQIVQDSPGSCPICGMDLVLVEENKEPKSDHADHPEKEASVNTGVTAESFFKEELQKEGTPFHLSKEKVEMLKVAFFQVSKRKIQKEIRSSVRITPDERRLYRISTKVSGWIEKLYVNQTGQPVEKGDPLFSVYSPDLVSAQYEYLSARESEKKLLSAQDPILENVREIRKAAYDKLRLYDMSDRQIKELEEKSGKPARETIIFSPATGFVTEKTVLEGQQIMPNDSLAVIADISHVWGEADIYEADMPYVTVGMPVSISLSYLQGKTFRGEIGFLYPFLDPQTRTLKARIEIPNPGNTLKPDMYAEAKMVYSVSQQIAVPEQAIMRTGTTDYVFVKGAEDTVFKREVQLGIRSSDGYFEVTSGLLEGEAVVASANFLVDSESSLKEAFRAAKESHAH